MDALMPTVLESQRTPFTIDYRALYRRAEELHSKYIDATPFPSILFEDFFSSETYREMCLAFPDPGSEIWKKPSNKHTQGKSVTRQGELGLKESLFNESQRRLFMELHSSMFLHFLEILTGISGLLPDPYFAEGSFAMSESGGYLDIHADFSHHDRTGLERRVNILFYLNDEWQEAYGGALTLYDADLKPMQRFFPHGNRLAVFTTSPSSFHGFPEPITCPVGMYRKSLNLYYYTLPRRERETKKILFPSDPSFAPTVTRD